MIREQRAILFQIAAKAHVPWFPLLLEPTSMYGTPEHATLQGQEAASTQAARHGRFQLSPIYRCFGIGQLQMGAAIGMAACN